MRISRFGRRRRRGTGGHESEPEPVAVADYGRGRGRDTGDLRGGTFEQRPERYRQLSVVNRTQEIAASGVKGVVMLHGVADGLVTHDISRQLQVLLRAQGVPVETTAFVTRSTSSEPGTTADGYLPTGLDSPFAGHASEASETHDVGLAGFAALAELYRGHRTGCSDRVVDGATGQTLRLYDGCA